MDIKNTNDRDLSKRERQSIHDTSILLFHYHLAKLRGLFKDLGWHNDEEKAELVQKSRNVAKAKFKELIKNGVYWELCNLGSYKESYENRKNDYLECFVDAEEVDFLKEELNKTSFLYEEFIISEDKEGNDVEIDVKFLDGVLGSINYKNISFSLIKRRELIEKKIKSIRQNQFLKPDDRTSLKPINFTGTQTEAIELIKGLIESQKISGVQKDIIERFSRFFNIDIKHPNKLIQDLKKRNNGSETLFLDSLKENLITFVSK